MFTSGSIPPPGPLSYEGQVVVPFINRNDDPQTTFNKFPVPTVWVNNTTDLAWLLVSKRLGVAVWIPLGGPTLAIQTITTPDATVVTPVAFNVNFLNGNGMTITGSGNNVTFNANGTNLTWTVVTAASQAMAVNRGYIANNASGVAFTLPATAAVGDLVGITTIQANGWTLAQAAGQSVRIGNQVTTTGVTGSVSSNAIGNTLILVCHTANTGWIAINIGGNLTLA